MSCPSFSPETLEKVRYPSSFSRIAPAGFFSRLTCCYSTHIDQKRVVDIPPTKVRRSNLIILPGNNVTFFQGAACREIYSLSIRHQGDIRCITITPWPAYTLWEKERNLVGIYTGDTGGAALWRAYNAPDLVTSSSLPCALLSMRPFFFLYSP